MDLSSVPRNNQIMFFSLTTQNIPFSYQILAPAQMQAEKDVKKAAAVCLEVIGLDQELYRLGHTKARTFTFHSINLSTNSMQDLSARFFPNFIFPKDKTKNSMRFSHQTHFVKTLLTQKPKLLKSKLKCIIKQLEVNQIRKMSFETLQTTCDWKSPGT